MKVKPISEAPRDGTKIIAWDDEEKDWYVSLFKKQYGYWVCYVTDDVLFEPTYFVDYLPDPTENKNAKTT